MDAQQHHLSSPAVFGPFEVIPGAGELRKNGIRVPLAGQPFQILLLLLESAGQVVTREELRERIWADGTFVDYEHSLNAAINKLRKALGDSAENPKFIQTLPGRGYRFLGQVDPAPPEALQDTADREVAAKSGVSRWRFLAIILGSAVLSISLGWWLRGRWEQPPTPVFRLAPLTTSAALEDWPSLSPDGKMLVYSSDPSFTGKYDLYLRQVSGGAPIQLTTDGDGNRMPDFSPDGTRIVFRSNRGGGGIYVMPAFGGEVQLVAPGKGLNPKFSPNGNRIAFWTGSPTVAAAVPGSGAVWVVPVAGGKARRIAENLAVARSPIWSTDGQRLLFIGYGSSKAFDPSAIDWWIAPADGPGAEKTGLYDELIRSGVQQRDATQNARVRTPVPALPSPGCWSADSVITSIGSGQSQNLWAVGLSPRTSSVTGKLTRLTMGTARELNPTCASDGTLAFTSMQIKRQLWSLPFDLDKGMPEGPLQMAIQSAADRENPSISANGRFAVFVSDQSGRPNIWRRDSITGVEAQVASSPYVQRYPLISPSANKIVYSAYEPNKRAIYLAVSGQPPKKLCEGCLRATDWSGNETAVLVQGESPYQVKLLNLNSQVQTTILRHPQYGLVYGRLSPDGRWISFTIRMRSDLAKIAIAPMTEVKPIPESSWIAITDVDLDDFASWSPDGKIIYFTSAKDGNLCLWGRRIDTDTGLPSGKAFAVQHFHGRVAYDHGSWSAAGSQFLFSLVETSSNVWTMSRGSSSSRQ